MSGGGTGAKSKSRWVEEDAVWRAFQLERQEELGGVDWPEWGSTDETRQGFLDKVAPKRNRKNYIPGTYPSKVVAILQRLKNRLGQQRFRDKVEQQPSPPSIGSRMMTRGRGAPSPVPRSSRGSPRLKPILGCVTGGGHGRLTPPDSVTAAAVARGGGGGGGGGGGKMRSENSPSPKPRGKDTPPSRRSPVEAPTGGRSDSPHLRRGSPPSGGSPVRSSSSDSVPRRSPRGAAQDDESERDSGGERGGGRLMKMNVRNLLSR